MNSQKLQEEQVDLDQQVYKPKVGHVITVIGKGKMFTGLCTNRVWSKEYERQKFYILTRFNTLEEIEDTLDCTEYIYRFLWDRSKELKQIFTPDV